MSPWLTCLLVDLAILDVSIGWLAWCFHKHIHPTPAPVVGLSRVQRDRVDLYEANLRESM